MVSDRRSTFKVIVLPVRVIQNICELCLSAFGGPPPGGGVVLLSTFELSVKLF